MYTLYDVNVNIMCCLPQAHPAQPLICLQLLQQHQKESWSVEMNLSACAPHTRTLWCSEQISISTFHQCPQTFHLCTLAFLLSRLLHILPFLSAMVTTHRQTFKNKNMKNLYTLKYCLRSVITYWSKICNALALQDGSGTFFKINFFAISNIQPANHKEQS